MLLDLISMLMATYTRTQYGTYIWLLNYIYHKALLTLPIMPIAIIK